MGLILKHESGLSLTFIFEARFRPESQIYRVSQDKRNCGMKILLEGRHFLKQAKNCVSDWSLRSNAVAC